MGIAEIARKAAELYNRYRAPEATASLVSAGDEVIVYRIAGPFCMGCCQYDWLEDMKYVLEDLGVDAELLGAEKTEDGYVCTFRVRGCRIPCK